jgi:hypothetical protein
MTPRAFEICLEEKEKISHNWYVMNSSTFKILACCLMVVDHVGDIFFPESFALRFIGRLVFPMFAFLIGEGYRHTKDPASYLGRLFIFALISQPFYMFGFKYPHVEYNIFFTLALGLYAIYEFEKTKSIFPLLFAALASECVKCSFGAPGVFMIFVMHYYSKDFKRMALAVFFLGLAGCARKNAWLYFQDPGFVLTWAYLAKHSVSSLVQPFAFLAVPLIALYNGKPGIRMKYFFYAFYPAHLAIFGIIRGMLHK